MKNLVYKVVIIVLAVMLSACANDQPGWLIQQHDYPRWQKRNRTVTQYDFQWKIYGSRKLGLQQVFSTRDEIWLQFEPGSTIPAILGVNEKGERLLPYYKNPPYVLIAKNYPRLVLQLGKERVTILHQ